MKTNYFHVPAYFLILIGLCINACNGQVNTSPAEERTNISKPAPKITGTPPPPNPAHNPYNDTGLVSQYIRTIFQDSKGNYWFGPAGQSVARYDGSTLHYFSMTEFFKGNEPAIQEKWSSIHAVEEDDRGNLWFGTSNGAVKYDGKTFRSYAQKEGLTNPRVGRQSILKDHSGTIWVGTQGGVFRYFPDADSLGGPCFSLFHMLPPINVKDIMEDSKGNIWFASGEQGVFRYDGKTVQNFTEQEGLSDSYAGGIAEDQAGNIWFTIKDGICRYDGSSFTTYTSEIGLEGHEVWGILIERSGIIWITARGSTRRFDPSLPLSDPEALRVFTPEDGLNCCVQSMYQDRLGNVWWGAGQGLFRFDGKDFYKVKQEGPW